MSNVLVMNENYIRADILTSQAASSQVAALPATNVYDTIRRGKVWRTAGYWLIDSTNKAIIFRESVGVDLTASIVEAAYTTDASFLTAIKTALEAAGASTYTVTRDTTTLKIKITSDGMGGGGILQLMWTDVLSTAATILGYDTGANDTGALTYTADVLKIHTKEFLTWDLGTASLPQALAICGTRNGGLQLSSSAVVTLKGNSSDAWTSPAFSQVLTYSQDVIALLDSDGLHTSALRYWRLEIVDPSNPDGYIELSNVYLGEVFEPSQGAVQFPFDQKYQDFSTVSQSKSGVRFADIEQVSEVFDLSWFALTKSEAETLRDFFELYGTYYPFWIALDPNEVFSTDYRKWIRMCRFDDPPQFSLESPNLFSSRWKLSEEV